MIAKDALTLLKMGNNCFITGPAGSGKTYLLNEYIKWLKAKNIKVAITASTGIAATHLQGLTIHSWSGLGVKDSLSAYDLESLLEKKYLWQHFDQTSVLIIDEISMLSAEQLDAVDMICRAFKKNDVPFGGMQIVLSGDFFQLPPIFKYENKAFAYGARAWRLADIKICALEDQYRQTDDSLYELLQAIRNQNILASHKDKLNDRLQASIDEVTPVRLFTHNVDVDEANNKELSRLTGSLYEYESIYKGNKRLAETIERGSLVMPVLRLKLKARVMFIKNNFDQGIANGTLGQVVGFTSRRLPIVALANGQEIEVDRATWAIEDEGKVKAELSQIPLRLAWATTVHKSQGMTLEAAEIDLSKAFVPGMGYVALSRVKSFSGLRLLGFNEASLLVNDEAVTFDKLAQKVGLNLTKALGLTSKERQKTIIDRFVTTCAVNLPPKKKLAHEETLLLVEKGLTLADMAQKRNVKPGTILTHLEKLKEEDSLPNINHLKPALNRLKIVDQAFKKVGTAKLSPVKKILPTSFSFDEIRLARLFFD